MHTQSFWTHTRTVSILTLSVMLGLGVSATTATAQIRPPLGNPSPANTGGNSNNLFGAPAPAPAVGNVNQGYAPTPAGFSDPNAGQTEQDLNNQAAGEYPAMTRSSTLPIGALQKKWNSPIASTGQTAPGIMRFVWRPDFVMPIRTREFMTTTIELPAWENVERIILGDTMVFEATRVKQNILVLRPSHSGADTNMTVIGVSGNIYNFYVRSEGWNSNQITDFTVYVSAGSPTKDLADSVGMSSVPNALPTVNPSGVGNAPAGVPSNSKDAAITPPDYIRKIAFNPENLRFDLKIYAPSPQDIEIAPLRVFTDGIWTYFDYGEKADSVRRPVIFRVVDGVDSMVNTRTAGPTGNIMIAEATGNFTLRNGSRVVCVYSEDKSAGNTKMQPVPNDDDISLFEEKPQGAIAPALPSQLQSAGDIQPREAAVAAAAAAIQEPSTTPSR